MSLSVKFALDGRQCEKDANTKYTEFDLMALIFVSWSVKYDEYEIV